MFENLFLFQNWGTSYKMIDVWYKDYLFISFTTFSYLYMLFLAQINDDPSLEIRPAVRTVETILTESQQRMTSLTSQWESWEMRISTSKQFKVQWHQFIQDARRVSYADITCCAQAFLIYFQYDAHKT